jgi:hypothetical protein
LEPNDFTRYRFSRELVKVMPKPSPWGYMNYNRPMNNDRFWELERLAEEVAGPLMFLN